ncbi:Abi family protein [Lactobacillus sp. ESL0701]|uniref:Abi family protein n=1 Tax=Lactobacillus sp. ESL0701 TaxID=2983217 RepID=UPI0023F7BF89|nr:Abi family protein [Lactobacillus sp. ESL0701]MDF7672292.1 Abi family protein [Lactobacillus sp. ESL0701]
MKNKISLRYIDQLSLFKLRGINNISLNAHLDSTKLNQQLKTISTIGYYNLKNYAKPYLDTSTKQYNNLSFDELVARYYRDKHLRQAVLHAIEDIETTLNTRIANTIGTKYGEYGYLPFRLWCQRNSRNKFLNNHLMDKFAIEKEQSNFVSKIQYKVKKSNSYDMKDFVENTERVYPPIWLLMNELTLGETIHIYKLMSKTNRKEISNYFGCKTDELVSWLESINLIRNICCHNGLLADFKLRTRAKVPQEFKFDSEKDMDILFRLPDGNYTNSLAMQICIIVKLMGKINNKYIFSDLKKAIFKLIDNTTTANYYGFTSKEAINKLFKQSQNNLSGY